MKTINENAREILAKIPAGVMVVAATKTRSIKEINEAVEAGIQVIGENYIQEAEEKFKEIGKTVRWHLIGHLQRNKVKKALDIFDCIETVDSSQLAEEIDKHSGKKGVVFPILIEINSGRESQKSGVMPEDVNKLIGKISHLKNISVEGLMTMGPLACHPEDIKPYFRLTKKLFDEIKGMQLPNVKMKYLSMGMSDTWKIAIEEGANIVRIGTAIFGPR